MIEITNTEGNNDRKFYAILLGLFCLINIVANILLNNTEYGILKQKYKYEIRQLSTLQEKETVTNTRNKIQAYAIDNLYN